jgi:hypothetical protein
VGPVLQLLSHQLMVSCLLGTEVGMLRNVRFQLRFALVIWALSASTANGKGPAPETVRVKIVTKEDAQELLKQLNKMGAAENLKFVDDKSEYVYWIEYAVTEPEPPTPADALTGLAWKRARLYREVECVVHGGNGVDGGYQLYASRRTMEPTFGIDDQVVKKAVKLMAKDIRRIVVLPPKQ